MEGIGFGAPQYLWLLIAPAVFLVLWIWRFARRLADLQRLRDRRSVPVRERFAFGGDLWFWLFLILSSASMAAALARPHGITTVVNRAGLDIVILQDGSASMHVTDVSAFARQDSWKPDGPGFVRLSVVDSEGRSDFVTVFLE